MSVRAPDGSELERVRAIVERCARAAAMASDVEVTLQVRQGYRDMMTNEALARCFGAHLQGLGRSPRDRDPRVGTGSTDMGDVSHVIPAIHPWLAIVDEGAALCHEHRFGEAAATDGARVGTAASSRRRRSRARPSSFWRTETCERPSLPSGGVENGDIDAPSLGVL